MLKDTFCDIWLSTEQEINKKMILETKSNQSSRDFFLEKIMCEYIPGFTLDELSKNEHGKPELTSSDISFNLSHCEEYYSLVISSSQFCGLDIQSRQSFPKFENALKSVLTDKEYGILLKRKKDKDFFQLWSVKEAFIKAKGSSIWYGRDYDFSNILPDLSDQWTFINDLYLYSTEYFPGLFVSVCVSDSLESIEFKKF